MSFYQNLLRICKENNTSPSAVAKEIGYSNAAAAYWKRGATPKLRTLRALGDYFNISWLEFIDPEERGKWLNLMPAVAEDKQGNWRKWASATPAAGETHNVENNVVISDREQLESLISSMNRDELIEFIRIASEMLSNQNKNND